MALRQMKDSAIDQVAGMIMFRTGLDIDKLKEECSRYEHFSLNQHIKNFCECEHPIQALLEIDAYAIELIKDNVDMITKFNIVYKALMLQVIRDEMPAILRRIEERETDTESEIESDQSQ